MLPSSDFLSYPKRSFSRADLNNQQEESTISNVKCERNTFESIVMRIQPKLKQTPTIDSDTIEKIERMIEKRTDGYSCTNCGHISKHRSHMKEHVEKYIGGLEYPCNSCNKVFRSSNSFAITVHKSRINGLKDYNDTEHNAWVIFRTRNGLRKHNCTNLWH